MNFTPIVAGDLVRSDRLPSPARADAADLLRRPRPKGAGADPRADRPRPARSSVAPLRSASTGRRRDRAEVSRAQTMPCSRGGGAHSCHARRGASTSSRDDAVGPEVRERPSAQTSPARAFRHVPARTAETPQEDTPGIDRKLAQTMPHAPGRASRPLAAPRAFAPEGTLVVACREVRTRVGEPPDGATASSHRRAPPSSREYVHPRQSPSPSQADAPERNMRRRKPVAQSSRFHSHILTQVGDARPSPPAAKAQGRMPVIIRQT